MDWFIGKARRKDKDPNPAQQEETKQYLHEAMLQCTTSEVKLREIVNLVEGLDYNEWLASHTIAFFDHVNLLYGTISEFCSISGCPDMCGPCNRQYLWVDEKGKRCKLAATQYIDYVMTYTQKTINDESIFPTKFDKEFPSTFESVVKKIMKLLFHVIAHIYHSHFKEIVLLNLHPHLNCIFAHIILFNERFKLIEEKELEVLHDLAIALKLYPPISHCDITQETGPNDNNNNNSISAEYCVNSAVTSQCRSISALDSYPNCDLTLSGDDHLLDFSDTKENANSAMLRFNSNPNQNLTDMNMDTNFYINSPMLVDENFDSKKNTMFSVASPEPMMVEPMTSSENIPKYTFDGNSLFRGRSISANAVLSCNKTFETLPTSPATRRCNSDRTSVKSNFNTQQSTCGR